MGDWTVPRRGLTPRERGFPPQALHRASTGRASTCSATATASSGGAGDLAQAGAGVLQQPVASALDEWLSSAFAWNHRYHRTSLPQRLAPSGGFWILRRRA